MKKLGLLIALLLSMSACSLPNSGAPVSITPTADTQSPPPATPETSSENTETITDTVAGIEYDYPAGWHVFGEPTKEAVAYAVTLTSKDLSDQPGTDGVPADLSKIDVSVGEPATDLEAFKILALGDGTLLSEEKWTLADGTPAIHMTISGMMVDRAEVMVTIINGRGIIVAGYGDTTPFEAIARSVRPI